MGEELDKAEKRRAKWARRVARGGLSRGQQKRADYHKRMERIEAQKKATPPTVGQVGG